MTIPLVICVCGGSGSGKTTLIKLLIEQLPAGCKHACLATDSFYYDLGDMPLAERRKRNFDHPDAVDLAKFIECLTQLKQGQVTKVPNYDFKTHTGQGESDLRPPDVLFVDGIFCLIPDEIESIADLILFLDVSDKTRFQRRLQRDQAERNRSQVEIKSQYEKTVRPMFEQFVAPTKDKADVIIPEKFQVNDSYAVEIAKSIENLLQTRKNPLKF